MKQEHIVNIIDKYSKKQGEIISILQDIQSQYNYLPKDALSIVSEKTSIPMVDIYGIVTFYKSFSLKPKGEHHISVCLGTACHVRGGQAIVEAFERELEVKAGEVTPDSKFTLETVNCLGACALGPIVVVDGHYFSKVGVPKVKEILKKTRKGLDKIEILADERVFPVEVRCLRCNHSLMDESFLIDGYPSIRVTVYFGGKHGWLRLSSLYGSPSVKQEYERPPNTLADFFCPHCHSELKSTSKCPKCSAPMVVLTISGGGIVQVCSRRGCKGHLLDINNNLSGY